MKMGKREAIKNKIIKKLNENMQELHGRDLSFYSLDLLEIGIYATLGELKFKD